MHFDRELDARGLNSPLPILRAEKALKGLAAGKVLRTMAIDPGSAKDFAAFAKQTSNEPLSSAEAGGEYVFSLHKA